MDGVDALRGRRVYLDANVFIYAVEGSREHAAFLDGLFDLLESGGAPVTLPPRIGPGRG